MKRGDQGLIIHQLNDKIAQLNEQIIQLQKARKNDLIEFYETASNYDGKVFSENWLETLPKYRPHVLRQYGIE